MNNFKVSVTDIAQLICRTGDLALFGAAGPSARDGQKAHKRWQEKTEVSTEVSVKAQVTVASCSVTLRGRIDVLDRVRRHITEIKSTLVPAEHVSDSQKAVHRAQVRLYAYCLLNEIDASEVVGESSLDSWQLDVLYVNLRDESPTRETEYLSVVDILALGDSIVERYVSWMEKVSVSHSACRSSAQTMNFPHVDYRAGQYEMASLVYRGARDGFSLLVEAPTGIGKTISTLFPAVKAIGEKNVNQVVYLTAKASGVQAVFNSIELMEDNGLNFNCVSLRSKQLTCFCLNGSCERDESGRCPLTIGFFDRLPDARDELLTMGVITPSRLDDVAMRYELCPFELSLQLVPWMHLVVCDYNYVFDPLVRLPWFSEPRRQSQVLVDEAHNLPDRSRSMFSAQLDRAMGKSVADSLLPEHRRLLAKVDAVDRAVLKHARGMAAGETVTRGAPSGLLPSITGAIELLVELMSDGPALTAEAVDWFKALCRYVAIDELYGKSHRTITTVSQARGKKVVRIELLCLDASRELNQLYKNYKSVSFFSATLTPASFYQDTLGTPEHCRVLTLDSPFDYHQSAYLLVPCIGTRYKQRDQSLPRLVELIHDVCNAKEGSYLVFLPSFVYLETLANAFTKAHPEQRIWKQSRGQSREERLMQLERLRETGAHLGFVILGGVFGEGVDYIGDRLVGAVVVGVGLPGLSAEQDLMAEHYQELGYDGYDYANRIPGFTRVLQTVGRVIRTESDKGVVVLVDDRFEHSFYQSNFPDHINPVVCRNRQAWVYQLSAFWGLSQVPEK